LQEQSSAHAWSGKYGHLDDAIIPRLQREVQELREEMKCMRMAFASTKAESPDGSFGSFASANAQSTRPGGSGSGLNKSRSVDEALLPMMHASSADPSLRHLPQPMPSTPWLQPPQPRHPVHAGQRPGPDGPYSAHCLRAQSLGDGRTPQAPRPWPPPLDEWQIPYSLAQCQDAQMSPCKWPGQSMLGPHHHHHRPVAPVMQDFGGPARQELGGHGPPLRRPPMMEPPMACLPDSPRRQVHPPPRPLSIPSAHFNNGPPMVYTQCHMPMTPQGAGIIPPSGPGFPPPALNLPGLPPCMGTHAVVH